MSLFESHDEITVFHSYTKIGEKIHLDKGKKPLSL
jgi:hypothetical protein